MFGALIDLSLSQNIICRISTRKLSLSQLVDTQQQEPSLHLLIMQRQHTCIVSATAETERLYLRKLVQVKPDNIILEGGVWSGRVYLLDFGGVQVGIHAESIYFLHSCIASIACHFCICRF